MPHRTFLAVDLDADIRDRLVRCQRDVVDPRDKVNLVSLPNLHITLNFLGDVADELLPEALKTISATAGQVEPFDVDVRGSVVVPSSGPVRMLWASVEDPTGRLSGLYESLSDSFRGLGLRQGDRRYIPHVTLARVRFLVGIPAFRQRAQRFAQEDFGVQHVREIVAYTSVLSSDGPTYTPLARADLRV
jgi:2'-5' RNA ligase